MYWIPLSTTDQLNALDAASHEKPVLIFKHSTRCTISSTALHRLERSWTATDDANHTAYQLDLLRYRDLSNAIADRYQVEHASPQVLVIRNGICIYTVSHFGITHTEVTAVLMS